MSHLTATLLPPLPILLFYEEIEIVFAFFADTLPAFYTALQSAESLGNFICLLESPSFHSDKQIISPPYTGVN